MTHLNTLSSRGSRFALGLSVFLAGTAFAASVMAEEACGDATCPTGFTCVTETYECDGSGGGSNPGAASGGATSIGTDPGSGAATSADPYVEQGGSATSSGGSTSSGSATSTEEEKAAACEPVTVNYCSPNPCESAADCGAGMVCASYTQSTCTGTAVEPCAADDEECIAKQREAVIEEPSCTEETVSQCAYQWTQPCQVASDCGAGFKCEETQSCSCSGSSGSGGATGVGVDTSGSGAATSSDDVAEDVAPPDVCSCEATGEFACVAEVIACTTDDNCPDNWTCEANGDVACSSDTGCETADPAMVCLPPGVRDGGGLVGIPESGNDSGGDGSAVPEDTEEGNATTDKGEVVTGAPEDATDEDTDTADTDESDDDKDAADGADASTDASGGGCTVAAPGAGSSALSLLVLGFAAALGLGRRRLAR